MFIPSTYLLCFLGYGLSNPDSVSNAKSWRSGGLVEGRHATVSCIELCPPLITLILVHHPQRFSCGRLSDDIHLQQQDLWQAKGGRNLLNINMVTNVIKSHIVLLLSVIVLILPWIKGSPSLIYTLKFGSK